MIMMHKKDMAECCC